MTAVHAHCRSASCGCLAVLLLVVFALVNSRSPSAVSTRELATPPLVIPPTPTPSFEPSTALPSVVQAATTVPDQFLSLAEQGLKVLVQLPDRSQSEAVLLQQSTAMPRVALCFFGLVKSISKEQLNMFRSNVVEPLRSAGYAIDGFLHTFNFSGQSFSNPRNREKDVPLDDQTASVARLASILNGSLSVRFDAPALADDQFSPLSSFLANGDPWPENRGLSVQFFLRQQYSLWKVTEMWSGVSLEENAAEINVTSLSLPFFRYDGVIYLRPDTLMEQPLPLGAITTMFGHPARRIVWERKADIAVPRFEFGGLHDRFAFGTPLGMLLYGARGIRLRHYVTSAKRLPHAETYLGHFLCENGVAVHLVPVVVRRWRGNGHTPDWDSESERRRFVSNTLPLWLDWVRHSRDSRASAVSTKAHMCTPRSAWPVE